MKVSWKHLLSVYSFYPIIGLLGTIDRERRYAQLTWRIFSYILMIIAVGLLYQWHAENNHLLSKSKITILNSLELALFIIGYFVMIYACRFKKLFIRNNWMLPIIIMVLTLALAGQQSFVVLWTDIRPYLAIYIMIPTIRLLKDFFIDGKLQTTLIATAIIIVVFGLLLSIVDPSIHSPGQGIWYALATVSTVGYGDVVPVTPLGKLLGGILIILGVGIFVVVTANILAILLRKEKKKSKHFQQDYYIQLKKIENRLAHIEEELSQKK